MPKVGKEVQKYYESRIRSVLVFQPDASLADIQKALEDSREAPLHLQIHYVGKLRDKVMRERTNRFNKTVLATRLATIQDKHKAVAVRLWREAMDPHSPAVARIMALDKLMQGEFALLEAEMDAGVYERKLGTVEVKETHEHTIARELLMPIMAAFQHYGMIRKEAEKTNGTTNQPALPDASGTANK